MNMKKKFGNYLIYLFLFEGTRFKTYCENSILKLWKIIENKTKLINLLYKFIIIIRYYREVVRKKVKRLN